MTEFTRDITVSWGESDPAGMVYYPNELAWFNDAEHDLFRAIGFPIHQQVRDQNTGFVMGEVNFRFVGPAFYGDPIRCRVQLARIGTATLHWRCTATNLKRNVAVTEGTATRVYVQFLADGSLKSAPIPDELRQALSQYSGAGIPGDSISGQADSPAR